MFQFFKIFAKENGEEGNADEELGGGGWKEGEVSSLIWAAQGC